MAQESDTRTISCPTCKSRVEVPEAGTEKGAFPFCSPRCRAVDLGHWLDERYTLGDEPNSVEH